MTIDDIEEVRRSRALIAQYRINPFSDRRTHGLWEALQKVSRVRVPDPAGPPITWSSPRAFTWKTLADTLLFEQVADSVFQMTVRPRVR